MAHTQATDHRILKVPSMTGLTLPSQTFAPQGSRFPAVRPDEAPEPKATETRDLALAWQTLAQQGVGGAAPEAEHFLRRGVAEGLEDLALLSGFAYFELERGGKRQARDLYERALKADPTMIDAATNLGVIEAHQARMDLALPLSEEAFRRAPAHSAIGMNLARYTAAAMSSLVHGKLSNACFSSIPICHRRKNWRISFPRSLRTATLDNLRLLAVAGEVENNFAASVCVRICRRKAHAYLR
jgi:tetratricopeptide (TPR) repeat protein